MNNANANTNSTSNATPAKTSSKSAAARLKVTYLKVKVAGGKTLTYIFRPRKRLSRLLSWLLSTLVATVSGHSYALDANAVPTGGNVGAGSGVITQNGANLKVTQATQDLVVNWNTFNIGSNASVNFVQPNAASIALNRVISSDPSLIFGSLTSNGKVFLTNPSGVLFGASAKVDVGSLVATSLSISDSAFLAGRASGKYVFSGADGAGSVINLGTINAAQGGYVALLAPEVRNQGIITARMGTVALAGGNKMTMDVAGDGLIKIAINEGAAKALASNKGMIQADGGMVYLGAKGAGDLASTVVNNEGVIEARSLVARDGKILLEALGTGTSASNSGTLNASGVGTVNGGDVRVLGIHGGGGGHHRCANAGRHQAHCQVGRW